jgi:hypothetical protein
MLPPPIERQQLHFSTSDFTSSTHSNVAPLARLQAHTTLEYSLLIFLVSPSIKQGAPQPPFQLSSLRSR